MTHHNIDQSCRGKLAELNQKVTHLERELDFLEASINGAANQVAVSSEFEESRGSNS